ncbi:protein transport protein sec73 [Karstenula rhodostoma CBS 690.94]|uniref:Protein transport protein sec73 n=1 Tax=Karstenula rhodostoma CBS 690.94 TaxID=1392251 RepID=A0A9P4PUG6_9PLEO|nr:protein transport protein sec73 [Karstenula rhodostoma CBS 690.94]
MPLRALRPGRSEKDLKRRSTLDPAGFFKRGDRLNKSAEHLGDVRHAASEDGGARPLRVDEPRKSWSATHESRPSTPPVQEHTPLTRRFSLMRFRHASDSQLSTRAKEHADDDTPPVPAVPANATSTPAIITTAPTMLITDEQPPKKRGRFQQLSLRRRSFDPSSVERPGILRKSTDKKGSSMDVKRSAFGFGKSRDNLFEEPGRLSTNQRPHTLAESPLEDAEGTSTSAPSLPVPRQSDSSRSDGSSTGHVSFENPPRPRQTPKQGSSRTLFGRKKQRASLFPLPMKITPPEFPDTAPATPRASTSAISNSSAHHSPGAESPPLTAIHHPRDLENGSRPSPMPSPSQLALTAANMNLSTTQAGALLRNDSQRSIHSARSSPHSPRPKMLGLRGRSATMGSLGGLSDDDPPPTPPYTTNGRVSTSTAGRSSFSNLFGLSSRFRQNSEPHSARHASPTHGGIGTPGLTSHQTSLNISREALFMPEREEGETPGHYLERMEENNIGKSAIASYLTKTEDPFLLAVLRSYMRKFAFFGDPIDMAIRKLLMQVELPKETQQIDRVLQGFSDRYHECNPGIYINPDKAYFISFSIVILHTDFFNKNNKRKMQRADYIKNSSCEGVSEDVLGCIYDNVVYTPFIHIEDDVDLKTISSKRSRRTAALKGPMNDPAKKVAREPIDPYTLIFEGKLDVLRPNIKDVMNLDDPYNYLGTAPTLDTKTLWRSFSRFGIIQIVSSRSRPEAFMSQDSQDNPQESSVGIVEMPVTKVGVLWRKDNKRKKTRSPWQEWGAILTRSGLSLFHNSSWAKNLMNQHEQHEKQGDTSPVHFQPPLQEFKQDHMIPMDGAVALVDNTYKKHKNSFVMFSRVGEETFLADSEKDLNDWLAMLNYTAAHETLGVRPRGLQGDLYEGQRNRAIRRGESAASTKTLTSPTGDVTLRSGGIDKDLQQQMRQARKDMMQTRISESEERLTESIRQLEGRLRDARHLQILAPIQPKSRELVIHGAGRLSAKLKWSRIEIWRMKCHRDILAQVLEDEKHPYLSAPAPTERAQSTSQASDQKSSRASRIGSLARLSSKTSSLTNAAKPPLSPTSLRPETKSSRDSDFGGDDAFRTPPETTHSSPNMTPATFTIPPFSLSPRLSAHRPSLASSMAQSPKLSPNDHRPSMSTADEIAIGSDGASDAGSQYTTPPHSIGRRGSDPRTPDLQADGLRLDNDSESEFDPSHAALTGSPESRSKVRRSLHRTLRESHGSSAHRRGHKARDSASTIVSNESEGEGLARTKGSFTVHGKKASVIQFGPDWHNTPAEERLKTRKQAQEALEEAGPADERGSTVVPDSSVAAREGAVAALAATAVEASVRVPASTEVRKQRHASAQTITPTSYKQSLEGHEGDSDAASQMSEIQEESRRVSPKHSGEDLPQASTEEETSRAHLNGPQSQSVEA